MYFKATIGMLVIEEFEKPNIFIFLICNYSFALQDLFYLNIEEGLR